MILLESYIFNRRDKNWNDFVAVFIKDKNKLSLFKNRILKQTKHFYNGYIYGLEGILNYQTLTEDHKLLFKKQYIKRVKKKIKLLIKKLKSALRKIVNFFK